MKRRVSTARTAPSNSVWGLGRVDGDVSAALGIPLPDVELLEVVSKDCDAGSGLFSPDSPFPRLELWLESCAARGSGAAVGGIEGCEPPWLPGNPPLVDCESCLGCAIFCAASTETACSAPISGGGTVVVLAGRLHRCDSKDRNHGIAAAAMRTRANRMGSLFLMTPICRICRIFQRFAL